MTTKRTISVAAGLLLLAAGGCGGAASPTDPTPTPAPSGLVTIFINGDLGSQSYVANPTTVSVGQMVNWKNNDSTEHSATLSGTFHFDTGLIPRLSAHDDPVAMTTAGTFTFHCSIHPGMVGTIIVR